MASPMWPIKELVLVPSASYIVTLLIRISLIQRGQPAHAHLKWLPGPAAQVDVRAMQQHMTVVLQCALPLLQLLQQYLLPIYHPLRLPLVAVSRRETLEKHVKYQSRIINNTH